MSIYDKGDFTVEQVVDYSIEYPLAEYGDTTTKLYKMVGRVNAANYNPGASLTGASGRYCGEASVTSISGGMIEFVRLFCSVPSSRTEYSSGTYTSQPVYGTKTTATAYNTSSGDVVRAKRSSYTIKPSKTEVVATRIEISYTTTPQSIPILTAESFTTTQLEGSITIGSALGYYNVSIENEGDISIETTGDIGVIEGTTIRRWLGDIYEVSTTYKL